MNYQGRTAEAAQAFEAVAPDAAAELRARALGSR